jgi:hypothetical protein
MRTRKEGSRPTMNPGTFRDTLSRRIGRPAALSVAVTAAVMLGLVFPPGALAAPVVANTSGAGPATCAAALQAASAAETAVRTDTTNLANAQNTLSQLEQALSKDEAAVTADQDTINNHNHLESQENIALSNVRDDMNEIEKELVVQAVEAGFSTFVASAIEAFKAANTATLIGLGEIEEIIVNGNWAVIQTTTRTVVLEITTEIRVGATLIEALEAVDPLFLRFPLLLLIRDLGYLAPAEAALAYYGYQLDNTAQAFKTASNEITDDEALVQADLDAITTQESKVQAIEAQQASDQAAFEAATAQVTSQCYSTSAPLPAPNNGSQALTWGDPHLVTFDGATYNFQQVGEFVLTESTIDDFEIQVRQQPWDGTSCAVAENSAFAFHIGGQTVSVYAQNPGLTTLVDGDAVTLDTTAPYDLPGGGTITNNAADAQETLVWPNGSSATVNYGGGFYLTLSVTVSATEKGHLVGLLGTDAGNPATDLTTSTGTVLPYPAIAADTATLYGTFSNGWRVTSSDSLFTYGTGQSTATFTNTAFPCQDVDLGTLTPTQLASATATCQAAGAGQEPFLDGCVLDVAVTGDDTVAGSDAEVESAALGSGGTTTATQSIMLVSGDGTVGSLDPNVTVEDSCAGTTTRATIVAPDPGAWADPISGTQWDSVNSGYVGCNETFTTTFTLPAGAVDPEITVTDMADNSANVSVNGDQPFITGNVSGQCETDYTGSPMSGSTTNGLVTGTNTLTFDVDNCYPADGESPTGIDFSANVTYSTTGT